MTMGRSLPYVGETGTPLLASRTVSDRSEEAGYHPVSLSRAEISNRTVPGKQIWDSILDGIIDTADGAVEFSFPDDLFIPDSNGQDEVSLADRAA